MKAKSLMFLSLFCSISFIVSAQLKIGDNPSTITSNSLLELESTNKGLLFPRVALSSVSTATPLTAPISEGMIVYSLGGSVTNGYYYWNGTKWVQISSTSTGRNNYVLVKSASDLPAASGGIITLASGTVYEINGTISVSSKIDLNGCWVTGMDAVNDKLVYTGTAELFTGSNGGNIRSLTLMAASTGAKVFNLDAGNAAKNFVVENCYILGSDYVGTIKGFAGNVYFQTVAFLANNHGITFDTDYNVVLLSMLWDVSNKNTYEKFTGTFNVIQQVAGDMLTSSTNSAVAMDVSGITSIVAGEFKTVLIAGTGTFLSGSFSKQWEVESTGISTEKDDLSSGNIYLSSTTTNTFSAAATPVKVNGTTTSATLFRVTSPSSMRMTYGGTKARRFTAICSLSLTCGSNNKYYSVYFAKNGVVLPESKQSIKLTNGGDQNSVTLSCTVSMAANDYLEVWIQNDIDATAATVQSLNFAIK